MPDGDGRTILLVEDEPQIRRLLRTTLAAHGYRLIESSTGEDGLQQAARRLPDLVIVDLGLPDLDGVDVIKRLREWSTTPIIVLSARGDLAHRRVSVEGRDVHLTPHEYRLLTTLARHAGKVLTHHQLLKEVWGPPYTEQAHYLRVYMAQLRRKLEADPARPRYLLTEPGVGYRLAAE